MVRTDAGRYSGFHQGAGEIAAAELLAADLPRYGLVLIDEIETSLHPRAQRRLVRDLARIARELDLQIIMTTHSPYVLEEIPSEGRIYLMKGASGRTVVTGVSPDFAMSRMDEEARPECDIYVEDVRAEVLLREILIGANRDIASRVRIIPFGSASVGAALGMMVHQGRFPTPSLVYLDGDQTPPIGCGVLPGNDAPERVVFTELSAQNWPDVATQIRRGPSETIDALNHAVAMQDHHLWLRTAADELTLGTDILWHALATSWVANCLPASQRDAIVQAVEDALAGTA
ncbi:ATP-dependent nuclease [Inquilinus limosus]|uniref:ATP-dependent nuclease n=1 Tax=Inquilinus limosus TaxID=171674 RepID=UPI003F5CE744